MTGAWDTSLEISSCNLRGLRDLESFRSLIFRRGQRWRAGGCGACWGLVLASGVPGQRGEGRASAGALALRFLLCRARDAQAAERSACFILPGSRLPPIRAFTEKVKTTCGEFFALTPAVRLFAGSGGCGPVSPCSP